MRDETEVFVIIFFFCTLRAVCVIAHREYGLLYEKEILMFSFWFLFGFSNFENSCNIATLNSFAIFVRELIMFCVFIIFPNFCVIKAPFTTFSGIAHCTAWSACSILRYSGGKMVWLSEQTREYYADSLPQTPFLKIGWKFNFFASVALFSKLRILLSTYLN